jgi:hypothetical protein
VVPNLYINCPNNGEKSLGGQIFNVKIKNMSKISLSEHLKGAFSIQTTLWKGPAGILKSLGGQNNACGHKVAQR